MGFRKHWRKVRERQKRINEAIEQNLTPEQKLAIHRTRAPLIVPMLLTVCVITIIVSMSSVLIFNSYTLREAFGDNTWETFADKGVERAMQETAVSILPWMVVIVIIILFGLYLANFWFWARRETKLEHEILAQIKKVNK